MPYQNMLIELLELHGAAATYFAAVFELVFSAYLGAADLAPFDRFFVAAVVAELHVTV